jgi:hypothetical protein
VVIVVRSFTRILQVVMIAALGFGPAFAAPSAPGTGTATISPATATVGTPGMWTIVYSPADPFTNGTFRVTIPDGWTAPQDASATSAGYVTVSSDHAGAGLTLSISGQVITISVAELPKPKIVTLVYGDDASGANPGARATTPTVSNPAVSFVVESDPLGTAVQPITASPTVNLQPGAITQIAYITVGYVFESTSEAGPIVVQARDTFGNPSSTGSNQRIDLSTTSATGQFSALGGGSFTPVSYVTMAAGSSEVSFYYRDTRVGLPTITASAFGQPWPPIAQQQQVTPGPASTVVVTPADTTITAGDFMRFMVEVVDANGNRAPLGQQREFLSRPPRSRRECKRTPSNPASSFFPRITRRQSPGSHFRAAHRRRMSTTATPTRTEARRTRRS